MNNIQTLADLGNSHVSEDTAPNFPQVGIEYAFSLNPNSNAVEPHGPQRDSPTACVIAQQYSSTPVVSLRFHSRKKKTQREFKKCYSFFSLV
jgi:hypothetical protein